MCTVSKIRGRNKDVENKMSRDPANSAKTRSESMKRLCSAEKMILKMNVIVRIIIHVFI